MMQISSVFLFFIIFSSCSQLATKTSNRESRDCSSESVSSLEAIESKSNQDWFRLAACYISENKLKRSHYIYNLVSQTAENVDEKKQAQAMVSIIDYLLGHNVDTDGLRGKLGQSQLHMVSYSKMLLDSGRVDEANKFISQIPEEGFEKNWLFAVYHFLKDDKDQTKSYLSKLSEREIVRFKMMNNYIEILKSVGMEDKARGLASKYQ